MDPRAVGGRAVHGLGDDSRRVRPGDVFVALKGDHADGHDHLVAATAAGAVASIVERPVPRVAGLQLVVDRSPAALASAAAWWYGDPSHELAVVGVTGTDGKTTTTFLAAAALEAAGVPTGLVGTIETRVGPSCERTPDHVTTPGALRLQALLRAMAAGGDRAAVLETTSHGLAAERVGSVAYDAAIFTNLSHEHLEFHGTYEAYRAAKLSLFERLAGPHPAKPEERPRVGIVNADDPAGDAFAAATRAAGARLVSYGLGRAADVRATSIEEDAAGLRIGCPDAGLGGPGRAPSGGPVQCPQRPRGHRPRGRLGARSGGGPGRRRGGRRACPVGWSGWIAVSRSRSSWTTPTARRPSPACSTSSLRSRRPRAAV